MQLLKKILIIFLCITGVMGCVSIKTQVQNDKEKRKPEYRVQLGINHGGIVENTNLTEIETDNINGLTGATESVDAFTGATKAGVNAGAHMLIPLKTNNIELGVDYMLNNQTFSYCDSINMYYGNRKILTSQFLFPITYNIGLFKKKYKEGLLQIKLGYVFQYNLFNITSNGSHLPQYSVNNFSNGITLGFTSTPFELKNGSKFGFYVDMYRGSQAYEDFYNLKTFEMPATSFFKGGIIYHFKTKY